MTEALLQVLVGIAIAAASSWITVQLSRRQFQSDRWWEKKVEAYERVIEAFHNAKRFASEHMAAMYREREVAEERDKELRKLAHQGREEIARASDIGGFILSREALSILAKYEAQSEALSDNETWQEYIDAEWSLIHSYMKEFISEAHRDLRRGNSTDRWSARVKDKLSWPGRRKRIESPDR